MFPPWIDTAERIGAPAGSSSGGRRWASGTELPAMKGKASRRDSSYIALAMSQR